MEMRVNFKVLIFIVLITAIQCKEIQLCSVLYGNQELTGLNVTIFDNGIIPDMEDIYFNNGTQWNQTLSFYVNDGCKLTFCNESYFIGTCQEFTKSIMSIDVVKSKLLKSANCTCDKVCQCSDVRLRRSECARAYISKGCDSCNAYYTDLQKQTAFFPSTFVDVVDSVIVKEGCVLTAYEEEEYEGEYKNFTGIITKWEDPILSYKCWCDPEKIKINPKDTNGNQYPELINIPDSLENITSLINNVYGRHEGLMASLESVKNKRSPKNAYILLIGTTGAGKSSAINLLFDNPNVTKVGADVSTTTNIHEFRIPISVDELGIANGELRVIDTPGLGDTRGLEQDAKFLATLDDYLSGHEELSVYIPNVILIFEKFNNNRMLGEGSNFVKMLRGFDLFNDKIIHKKFPNIVFVLSHFMSEPPTIVSKPAGRLKSFKTAIENYSLIPKPVTIAVAENKADEYNLLRMNGFFKLPNGEFYPKNLFEKIQKACLYGGDPIGQAIIRTGFKDSDTFNVSSITFPLVHNSNKKVAKYLQLLIRQQLQPEKTEVSIQLAEAYTTLSPDLKTSFPEALIYLQKAFNLRNINLKSHIPKTTYEIVKLLKEIQLNPANLYLIEKAFNLKIPDLQENLITGHGFDVFNDKPLPSSPFDMEDKIISDIGYSIPKVMSVNLMNKVHNIYNMDPSKEDYMNTRLKQLNVENNLPFNLFKGALRPGFNIYTAPLNSSEITLNSISALREYRKFELVLNDKFKLNSKFVKTAKELPKFNKSDSIGIELWKSFFNEYGTHVVKSTYGGGSIEIVLNNAKEFNTEISSKLFNLLQFAEDVVIGKRSNETLINSEDYKVNFKGGEEKFHVRSFKDFGISESTRLLEEWRNSLDFSPAIFQSSMTLLPINEVAKKIKSDLSVEIQKAASALFNASLTYSPPKEIIPEDRQNTKSENEASVIKAFTETITKMMEEQNRKIEEQNKRIEKTNQMLVDLVKNITKNNEEQERKREEREKKFQDTLIKLREQHSEEIMRMRREDAIAREKQHAQLMHYEKLRNKKILRPPIFTCGDGDGFRCWHNDHAFRDQSMSNSGWSYKCSFEPGFGGNCYCTARDQYIDAFC